MSLMQQFLEFNQQFVENKDYEQYITDKYPEKRAVILTCMDTRLMELLPKALNLRNGDCKFIKNAGAILTQPFGSAMRSILVAVYELKATEIFVIGHYGCGMTNLDSKILVNKMITEGGVDPIVIETIERSGIRMEKFLRGFDAPEHGVIHSVKMIRSNPLFPSHVPVHGCIIDPTTGKIDVLVEDYREE